MELQVERQQVFGGSYEFSPEQVAEMLKHTKFMVPPKDLAETIAKKGGPGQAELVQIDGDKLIFNPTGPDPLKMKGYEIDIPTEPGQAEKLGFAFGGQPVLLDGDASPLPVIGFSVPGGPKFNVLEAMGLNIEKLAGGVIAPRLPDDPERLQQLRLYVDQLQRNPQRDEISQNKQGRWEWINDVTSLQQQSSSQPSMPLQHVTTTVTNPQITTEVTAYDASHSARPLALPITAPRSPRSGGRQVACRTEVPSDVSMLGRSVISYRPGSPVAPLPSVAPVPYHQPIASLLSYHPTLSEIYPTSPPSQPSPVARGKQNTQPHRVAQRNVAEREDVRQDHHRADRRSKIDRHHTGGAPEAYRRPAKPNLCDEDAIRRHRKQDPSLCGADMFRYTQLANAAFQQTQNWLAAMGVSPAKKKEDDITPASPEHRGSRTKHRHRDGPKSTRHRQREHRGSTGVPPVLVPACLVAPQPSSPGHVPNFIKIDDERTSPAIARLIGTGTTWMPSESQERKFAAQRSLSPPQITAGSPETNLALCAQENIHIRADRSTASVARPSQLQQQESSSANQESQTRQLLASGLFQRPHIVSEYAAAPAIHDRQYPTQRDTVETPAQMVPRQPQQMQLDSMVPIIRTDTQPRVVAPAFISPGVARNGTEVPLDLEGLPEILKLACQSLTGAVSMPQMTPAGEVGPGIPTTLQRPTLLHPQLLHGGFTAEEIAEAKTRAIAEGRIKEDSETGQLQMMTPAEQIAFAQRYNEEGLDAEAKALKCIEEAKHQRTVEAATAAGIEVHQGAEEIGTAGTAASLQEAREDDREPADSVAVEKKEQEQAENGDANSEEQVQKPHDAPVPQGPQGKRVFQIRGSNGETRDVECVTLSTNPKIDLYRNFLDDCETEELKEIISKVQALPYVPNNLLDSDGVPPRILILLRRISAMSKIDIEDFVAICPSVLVAPSVDATKDYGCMFRVYLDDADPDHKSNFVHLGITVTPQKGSALLWRGRNDRGIRLARALHSESGSPERPRQLLTAYVR